MRGRSEPASGRNGCRCLFPWIAAVLDQDDVIQSMTRNAVLRMAKSKNYPIQTLAPSWSGRESERRASSPPTNRDIIFVYKNRRALLRPALLVQAPNCRLVDEPDMSCARPFFCWRSRKDGRDLNRADYLDCGHVYLCLWGGDNNIMIVSVKATLRLEPLSVSLVRFFRFG